MTEEALILWARRLAPTAVLIATCIGYLSQKRYPLMTPEVLILLLFAVAFGVALGFASLKLPDWINAVVLGMLCVLFFTFVFNSFLNTSNFLKHNVFRSEDIGLLLVLSRRLVIVTITIGIPIAVAVLLRKTFPLAVFVGMTVLVIGAILTPYRSFETVLRSPYSSSPPHRLVLHLIMDEFVGNGGIGDTFPGGAALRKDVADFFVGHGFQLHEGAFSAYRYTGFSIPAELAFSRPSMASFRNSGPPTAKWFGKLRNDGYRIAYVGSNVLPVCKNRKVKATLVSCTLVFSFSLDNIRDSTLSPNRKALYIFYTAMMASIPWFTPPNFDNAVLNLDSHSVMAETAIIRSELANEGGDFALVAHILLPHSPTVYDKNCVRWPDRALLPPAESPLWKRLAYERAYADQIRCALKQIDNILEVIDRRWPQATIIVHGDHGLRLRPFVPSRDDIRLRFAALFAVRAKGIPAGIVSRDESLQSLFAFYAGGVRLPDDNKIYISDASFQAPDQTISYPP